MSAAAIQPALEHLLAGRDLGHAEAYEVMGEVMRGEATPAQIGGFLVALRAKGETAEEIAGCAAAMREHVVPVHATRDDLVDTAGTGGDGAGTLNISTAAGIVAAAAGAGVAKHGNRAVSSASGSADVLEALGFRLELPPVRIAESIDRLGFGFMFAPLHHPAMRHAAPVRRELATRTVFNVLGPLTNPASARAQVIGVYAPGLVRTIAEVALQLGATRAYVVHGHGGIDELSPAGPSLVAEVADGSVREWTLEPEQLGLERVHAESLRGGSPDDNARAIRDVFAGGDGGHRAAVLLNAAGAIAAAGHAGDLREGLELAREAIDSGAASSRLDGAGAVHTGGPCRGLGTRLQAPVWRASRSSSAARRRPATSAPTRPPQTVAPAYERGGAAAMSVLVDERFGGSWDDLREARAATGLPLLAKGFFGEEADLRTAREAGADAVLLLLRDLDDARAAELMAVAKRLGLDALVEAHDEPSSSAPSVSAPTRSASMPVT